jgi:hypothetical protein
MARTIRSVSGIINQMISLTRILIIAQNAEGVSVTQLMIKYHMLRYAKIAAALAGIGGGVIGLVALAAGLAAGAPAMPIAQTMPGQYRIMQATAPVLGHTGEVISRPMSGAGGAGGFTARNLLNIENLNVSPGGMSPEEFIEYSSRRMRTKLRTLTTSMPR